MNTLTISPSPHIHNHDTINYNMYGVVVALIPAWICSVIFFGWSALYISLTSVSACLLFEFLIQKYLLKRSNISISDGSAIITGLLLAFNVPSNLPLWIIIIGALVAIGIGKMSFGGLGCNIFNPALVGRVFLLISFPVQMTSWPVAKGFETVDAVTGPTPLAIVKEAMMKHENISYALSNHGIDYGRLFWGNTGGSLGEIAAFALLIGFAYLLIHRVITWHIPITIFATIFVFSGLLHLYSPYEYADPIFQLLSGGVMLGAIFMATDYSTSPMNKKGMVVFGIGIGMLTIIIRTFGIYPEGMSFAILIMNAFTPLINRFCKPKRFAA